MDTHAQHSDIHMIAVSLQGRQDAHGGIMEHGKGRNTAEAAMAFAGGRIGTVMGWDEPPCQPHDGGVLGRCASCAHTTGVVLRGGGCFDGPWKETKAERESTKSELIVILITIH